MSEIVANEGQGLLDNIIRTAKRTSLVFGSWGRKLNLDELTVLQNDPYRLDTDTNRENGQWFADQVQGLLDNRRSIHLRGLHYRIVSVGNVLMPSGQPYINNDYCWTFLSDNAAKAARWLSYVPFERIVDERNAPPELEFLQERTVGVSANITVGEALDLPDVGRLMPSWTCTGFEEEQRYRLIFIGEKVSLGEILRPVARNVDGELLLPTGEISDTLIYDLAKRAATDGRPTVVFYFSDFDPSGNQMPVSVSRKLQALRHLYFPALDIQVHHIGLTLDQVRQFDLPSTPLKPTDPRVEKWRQVMGHEQTEIDAMIALHPAALRQIAENAVAPFYDPTLAERTQDAEEAWEREANALLSADPGYEESRQTIEGAVNWIGQIHPFIRKAQARVKEIAEALTPPPIDVPMAEPDDVEAPEPLFTTDATFVDATLKLRQYKTLE